MGNSHKYSDISKMILISFIVGLVFGLVVTLLNLPIPAPSTLAGVMGIVGVYVGYILINLLK